jgi:hypothetical protein
MSLRTPVERRPAAARVPRRASLLTGAGVFAVLAPLALRQPHTYDGARMKIVAMSLVDHLTPLVQQRGDGLGLNTPYSTYGIGTSLVMAPLYALGKLFGTDGVRAMNLSGPLLYAATCAVTVEILRRRNHGPRVVALSVLLVLVASPLLAYGITDFSEPGVGLMIALAVLALDGVARGGRGAAYGAGAAAGGAVLFRTDSLVLIAVPVAVALIVLARDRAREATCFALAFAPALAVWAAYNAARFGSPLELGYPGQSFSHPFLSGVYGLTMSPGRGILVYAPILLVAAVVTPSLRGSVRVVAVLAFVLLAARVVFYARWWSWYGGDVWGPRFLAPVLPAFVPTIAAAFERGRAVRRIVEVGLLGAALALVGVLLTVQPGRNPYLAPAAAGTGRELIDASTTPDYVRRTDRVMFDWTRFPLRP